MAPIVRGGAFLIGTIAFNVPLNFAVLGLDFKSRPSMSYSTQFTHALVIGVVNSVVYMIFERITENGFSRDEEGNINEWALDGSIAGTVLAIILTNSFIVSRFELQISAIAVNAVALLNILGIAGGDRLESLVNKRLYPRDTPLGTT